MRIRQGEDEIWHRRAPASAPKINVFEASLNRNDKGGDQVVIQWDVSTDGEAEPEGWVQWSADEGKNWYALVTGLRPGRSEVDVSTLPSGRLQLRLLVSDGFHTAEAEAQVEIPKRGPSVSILNPRDGQTLMAGGTMRLLGTATSSGGKPISPKGACWLVDNDIVAEDVLDTFITAPGEGKHTLTLTVPGEGDEDEEGEDSITFITVGMPREKPNA